jgi:hypothetical protein
MGIMLYMEKSSWGNYPAPFDHISINPLSLVVFISALGGLWTFIIRFMQARDKIKQIDRENPLPQNNSQEE